MKLIHVMLALGFALTQTAMARPAGFEDANDYYTRQENSALIAPTKMAATVQQLGTQFAALCGDTFCAGDFSNLASMDLTCSINAASNLVGGCLWTFAGNYTTVDPTSGALVAHPVSYHCDLALTGATPATLASFLAAASQAGTSGYDGLTKVKIPGTSASLYDKLVGCL